MLRALSLGSLRRQFAASPQKVTTVVAAALAGVAVLSALAFFALRPAPQPPQVIYGSGRIEANEIRVGVEVAGRLLEVNAIEGAALEQGALLARIV